MSFKTAVAALVIGSSLLASDPVLAQHLATPELAQQRVREAEAARARDLARLDAAFSSPEAVAAAASLGVDLGAVRAGLPALSDADLQDLAARAAALESDPVAGAPFSTRQIVWIALIAVAVIVVIAILA